MGAASSIVILDYDINYQKFRVFKRIEIPRSEYTYDNAVNKIIEVNEIYRPAFIYVDAGAGEYQYERLHIYGDEHPETGLKNKVKRWQFAQTIEVLDPITHELDKKPMKPFMINQLTIAFERSNIILSPWDNTLYKQLIDYEVIGQNKNTKMPIYTDKNEHYVDALGLAFLAMVLEFKDLTNQIKDTNIHNIINISEKSVLSGSANHVLTQISESYKSMNIINRRKDLDDLPGDRPTWIKVPNGKRTTRRRSWGSRSSGAFSRSMW